MKNIILVKNLNDSECAKRIEDALSQTRVDYNVNLDKKCVIVDGNSDMVSIARNVLHELGFSIL